MESLIRNHGLVDGNKRVAIMAAAFWLEQEGYTLQAEEIHLYETTMAAAEGRLEVAALAGWLEANSRRKSAGMIAP